MTIKKYISIAVGIVLTIVGAVLLGLRLDISFNFLPLAIVAFILGNFFLVAPLYLVFKSIDIQYEKEKQD